MTRMNGLDLIKQVRADAQLKSIPFILVTGETKPENMVAANECSVSSYILKPFTADILKTKLVGIIGPF